MTQTKTEKIFLSTFLYVWPYIIIGTTLCYFITGSDRTMALNFFLGGAVSVMLMSHNYKTTMKTAHKEVDLLKSRALKNYFFRYGFYILILAITYFRSEDVIYLIPVFIGFLSFKVVMVANFFFTNIYFKKKGVDIDD
ncbi:MAG: ATP synthase subunit I [Candidatus Izemoplasmataceae bacterium]|jgi:hypothetical protein|uniref:ATP synthase subunit I n=1 Tax=Liberiplasma polymorphum TaxID=3374570 RepID=UPI003771C736